MSELKSHSAETLPSEKNFALVFAGFFLLLALYPILSGASFRWWALFFSAGFMGFGIIAPQVFHYPNILWFKLGNLLGAIIAPVVISLVYFVTVVPIGLFFRLTKKDLINQDIDSKRKSYWIKRSQPLSSMKNQF